MVAVTAQTVHLKRSKGCMTKAPKTHDYSVSYKKTIKSHKCVGTQPRWCLPMGWNRCRHYAWSV